MRNDFNEVSDLGLAASLSVTGFEIVEVNKDNPRRVVFVFAKSPELKVAIENYFAGRLLVPAEPYFSQIRSLKNRIYI